MVAPFRGVASVDRRGRYRFGLGAGLAGTRWRDASSLHCDSVFLDSLVGRRPPPRPRGFCSFSGSNRAADSCANAWLDVGALSHGGSLYLLDVFRIQTQVALEVAGSGFRGVGSFGNPAGAGTYFALVLSVGVLLLSGRSLATKVPKLVLASGVALSIIGGIASQSGTFLAASATMLVAVVIFVRRSSRIKLFWHTLLWSALLVASIGLALQRTEMISRNLTFQIDSFLAGSRLDSRYVRKDSSILAAWQDALEHPIAGVGAVKKDYYSLNDSLYVSVLTPSGFLGAPLFFVPVLAIAWKAWRARGSGEYALLWTAAMLTTGIGTVAMFAPRIGDWWWAVQGMFLSVTLTHFPRPTRVGRRVLRASGDGLSPKLVLAPAPRWHDGVV